jgi:hypothetical protein
MHDCDSFLFSIDKSIKLPPLGNFGEVPGWLKNDYNITTVIESFFCTGIKSYAILLRHENGEEEEIIRCKGMKLTCAKTGNVINVEAYRRQIESYLSETKETIKVLQPRKRTTSNLIPIRTFCHIAFTMQELGRRQIDISTKEMTTYAFGYNKS